MLGWSLVTPGHSGGAGHIRVLLDLSDGEVVEPYIT
ncbi:uncharacterized protein METZ01_LOCUS361756, partial [marine metagenome]